MDQNDWLEAYLVGMRVGVNLIADNSFEADALRTPALESIREMERKLIDETQQQEAREGQHA